MEKVNENTESIEERKDSVVLEIVADKYDDIEKTIKLVKNEIKHHINQDDEVHKDEGPAQAQVEGLNNLLKDQRVKDIIKSVAGESANNLIDKTLGAMNSTNSTKEKQVAFTQGIKELHSNYKSSNQTLKDDPALNFALSLVGLDKMKLSKFN